VSDLTLTVNKLNYRIACEAGQEDRVRALAKKLDEKVAELIRTIGHVGEQQLLMMAGLMLADETEDLTQRLAGTQRGGAAPQPVNPAVVAAREEAIRAEVMAAAAAELASALNDIAERVETMASAVEREIAAMP
jgi:cell division protein ZapA